MGHGLSSWSKYRFMAPATQDIPLGQVWMMGSYGGAPVLVALDSAGRIIMVPYGVTSIEGTATVTQAEKDREVQGKDGVTLRTLAVDANGQLIMVPRGQSGTYMDVDASGFLSTIMKGVDGVTLRTVAVDASGKILGVLQGDYAGALKTLAVDSQGRMLAVLTDPEDVFGNPHYMGAAELAVRLGSIASFDRRGQVAFMDDFRHGLGAWIPVTPGGAGAIVPSVEEWRSGGVSCKLTTNAAASAYVYILHYRPKPPSTRLGFEFSFRIGANFQKIALRAEVYDGSHFHGAKILYDHVNHKLQYLNSSGVEVDLATGVDLYALQSLFHTVKLVNDLAAEKYVRLLVNETEYDLSTLAYYKEDDSTTPNLSCYITVYNTGSAAGVAFVDDTIITQNEP